MNDPREIQLSALVLQRQRIVLGQKEVKKSMRDEVEEIDKQISELAADIESGQKTLFDATAPAGSALDRLQGPA